MSYRDRLTDEIHHILDGLAAQGRPWEARWIAHSICERHSDGVASGDKGEFWRWSGYTATREAVAKVINSRAADTPDRDAPARQIALPGFARDHLQDYYLVDRDGEQIGIPVTSLTDAELDAKADAHRKMGAACYAHADEIVRFKHWRAQEAA